MSSIPFHSHERELASALRAAHAAGARAMEDFRRGVAVEIKDDATPVTQVDKDCESLIHEVLASDFPGDGFHGEETGRHDSDRDRVWLVDPIDGTKSYIAGTGFFSTQIALQQDGDLVLGVSFAPAMDELAWAARGAGAWLNGQQMHVEEPTGLEAACVSLGNIQTLAAGPAWPGLGRIMARAGRTRGYGDFYHYHRLAEGKLHAVIESDLNILDIAALAVIVEEAGGRFTSLSGDAIDANTRSVLAAAPRLHDHLLEQLKDFQ